MTRDTGGRIGTEPDPGMPDWTLIMVVAAILGFIVGATGGLLFVFLA